jgi:HEAT repeat protein
MPKSNHRSPRSATPPLMHLVSSPSNIASSNIQDVLQRCVASGDPDRLDAAIDRLTECGEALTEALDAFLAKDKCRWASATAANQVEDDICYVLLRALARSSVPYSEKLQRIADCLHDGTPGIREAATHALGDLGGNEARDLLRKAATADIDPLVRESAQEAVEDLES